MGINLFQHSSWDENKKENGKMLVHLWSQKLLIGTNEFTNIGLIGQLAKV